MKYYSFLLVLMQVALLEAWISPLPRSIQSRPLPDLIPTAAISRATTPLRMAASGFGGGPKKKKEVKLKPKQQWDRYLDFKKEKKIRVAVRVVGGEEWLEVGSVKSKDNGFTEISVARQRALIAEHARRLFPLQISPKDQVEWAYWNDDTDDWKISDKTVLEASKVPKGVEKMVGFEGRPDPASGFYCFYNEGRLVNDINEMTAITKKLE